MASITRTANPAAVSASSNVATYNTVDIGAAAPNRIIVVAIASELASTPINSVTIDYGGGDVAMTSEAGLAGNFGAVYARLFRLLVPTGTTATIKVTFGTNSPSSTQHQIAVYRILDAVYSSGGSDGSTDMDATDPLTTGSITIPTGGVFVAVAGGATDTGAKTWNNASEDLDVDAGALRFTTATRNTALTTTAVTCVGSNAEDGALSYLIFADNTEPTTALSSPADAATISDSTPDLKAVGTDTNNDTVRHNVQVDSSSSFDSQLGSEITDINNTAGAIGVGFGDTGNNRDYLCQGFIPAVNQITAISFRVADKDGNTDIGYLIWIDAVDSNSNPQGTVHVGVGGVTELTNANIVTGTHQKYTLTTPVTVTPGQRYGICIVPWNTNTHTKASSYHDFMSSVGNPYANGRRVHLDGSFANPTAPDSGNADINFTVYGKMGTPLLDKVSGTDAGFTAVDDFNDNSTNTLVWTKANSADTSQVVEQNSRVEIAHNNTANNYNSLDAIFTVNLTGKNVSVKVVDVGNQALTSHSVIFGLYPNASNKLYMVASGGQLSAYKVVSNVQTQIGSSITYNATDHLYWRIREASGTTYFDTSPDGENWTNRWSESNPIAVTALYGFIQSGAWQAESSGSFGYFDDFNFGTTISDVFPSGLPVIYTVQSPLSDGVWYWRTRTIDPSGSNNYGSFATTRSFTLATSAIKTALGLAKASVKTVNGLAIASVKTIVGLQ